MVVADVKVQEKIKIVLAGLPTERQCSNGSMSWVRESAGYRCSCSGHYITLEEFNTQRGATIAAELADKTVQEKIKIALANLPAERKCPNGYAWVQESTGYRCSGGGHYITWEELNAKHEETKAVIVVNEKVQEKIKIVLASLLAERQCSNGAAWVQECAGYRLRYFGGVGREVRNGGRRGREGSRKDEDHARRSSCRATMLWWLRMGPRVRRLSLLMWRSLRYF